MKNKETRISNIKQSIEDINNKIRKLVVARNDLLFSLEKLENPVQETEQKTLTDQERKEQSLLDKNKFQEKVEKLQSSDYDPIQALKFQMESSLGK